MQRTLTTLVVALALIAAACGDSGGETTTTAATPTDAATTTTAPPPTTQPPATTQAPTTTVPPTTTTAAAAVGFEVLPTPVHQTLTAYNSEGEGLFANGTVEAHWYQWGGFYVVLYRGLNIEETGPLCPGNSIQTATGFEFISNSPAPVGHNADEVCVGVPNIATADRGTIQCGPLVGYVTDIPTDAEGALFGTVEINDGSGFAGHTSSVQSDIASTPEFDPGAPAYILPASNVDEGGTVTCVDAEAAATSPADVEDFIAQLAAGLREGNEAFLFPRLHPAVLELYGEDQCRTYTTPLEAPTLQLEVEDVTGPEPWTWERDERITDVDDVFTVALVRREDDTETEQELHVGIVDDELRWFTDCGDPLP